MAAHAPSRLPRQPADAAARRPRRRGLARRGREPRAALSARGPDPAVPGHRLPLRHGDRAPSRAALSRRHGGGRRGRPSGAPRGARSSCCWSIPSRLPSSCRPRCSGRSRGRARGCARACRCGAASRRSWLSLVYLGERLHLGWGVWWYFFLLLETRADPGHGGRRGGRRRSASAALLGHELHVPPRVERGNAAAAAMAQPASPQRRGARPASDHERRPERGGRAACPAARPCAAVASQANAWRISSRLARATRRESRRSSLSTGTSTSRGTGFSPESRASRAASPLIIASNALALSRARVSSMRRLISAWSTAPRAASSAGAAAVAVRVRRRGGLGHRRLAGSSAARGSAVMGASAISGSSAVSASRPAPRQRLRRRWRSSAAARRCRLPGHRPLVDRRFGGCRQPDRPTRDVVGGHGRDESACTPFRAAMSRPRRLRARSAAG